MTAVDLIIVGFVALALVFFRRNRMAFAGLGATRGIVAIVFGLGLTGAFHAADLLIMWVLPHMIPRADALNIMTSLHLNYRWGISVVGVVAMVIGFGLVLRSMRSNARRHDETLQNLRRSEEQLGVITDATPLPVVITRLSDGTVLYANSHLEKVFGQKPEEIIGHKTPEFIQNPEDREKLQALILQHGFVTAYELEARSLDGTPKTVLISLQPVQFKGEAAILSISHDITDRKHAEQQALAAMSEATLANRAKSEFLANMTHELRTPLNAIIGFSQALEQGIGGPTSDKQREYLQDIGSAGDHLLAVIGDILDLSKFELSEAEMVNEQVDLAEVIRVSVRLVRDRLDDNGLKLHLQGLDTLPLLRGDKRRLRQVILNLLSNAIKFTAAGGEISLTGRVGEDGSVHLEIADTGIGISPSDIQKCLRPFGQVVEAQTRKHEGTGLGLPICKSITEAHDGTLEMESELGSGTKVTLTFPAPRVIQGYLRASSLAHA